MSDLALNDVSVLRGTVRLSRNGRWVADLVLDGAESPTGRVTLTSGDGRLRLVGTVQRGGAFEEVGHVHVVGGNGGIGREVAAVHYRAVTLGTPLRALLEAAGESLSPTTDPMVLNHYAPIWTRPRGPSGQELGRLADTAGVVWRVLDDGSIWLGRDTYPDAGIEDDAYELLEEHPSDHRAVIATEQVPASLRPGTTFRDQKVETVEYRLTPEALTTAVWFDRPGATSSHPILGPLESIVRGIMRETAYHAFYPAKVVSQAADGTLEIMLEDPMPHMTGVPLYKPFPGINVRVKAGSRVLVGFVAGNPSRPFAFAWESGETESVPVADGGTLVFNPGTGGATLAFIAPGTPAPPASGPTVNIPLSGRIRS